MELHAAEHGLDHCKLGGVGMQAALSDTAGKDGQQRSRWTVPFPWEH